VNWKIIKNDLCKLFSEMFLDRKLTAKPKHGVIVLYPKKTCPVVPADYRPITLLNNDYKIMARIIAGRLKPVLAELLHPIQKCGAPGRTIFEAVATLRDAIVYAERINTPYVQSPWTLKRLLTRYHTHTSSKDCKAMVLADFIQK
jgi:hypothetical protein